MNDEVTSWLAAVAVWATEGVCVCVSELLEWKKDKERKGVGGEGKTE